MQQQPKNTPLSVVLDHLGDKTPIERMVVRLVKLKTMMKHKAESSTEWSIQNGEIQDAAGTKMAVVFKDRFEEVPTSWAGRDIILECKHGDKGLSGVYVFDDDYRVDPGKPIPRKIKVTATGQISLVGGDPVTPQQRPAAQQHGQQTPQDRGPSQGARNDTPPANRQQTQSGQGGQGAAVSPAKQAARDARHFLGQCVTAWTMCHDAATTIAWGVYERHGQLTAGGGVGMLADKLFIELARSGTIRQLPVGDVRAMMQPPEKKLGDLTALLGEAVNEAAVKKAQAMQAAARENSASHQGQMNQQQPADEEKTGYRQGLEDDDIPF